MLATSSLFAYFDNLAADRASKAGRDSVDSEPEAPASPDVAIAWPALFCLGAARP